MNNTNQAIESTKDGTRKKLKIIEIVSGEAHLQNHIGLPICHICKKPATDDTLIMRIDEKEFGYACADHEGVIQEFLKQFKMVPYGWVQTAVKE